MAKENDDVIEMNGVVTEVNRGGQFIVELETGQKINATISGKIRKHNIRILLNDKVKVEISVYDTARGRITYRTK